MIWYEVAIARNHDKVEFRLAHWRGARPPAKVDKLIFFVEIEVARGGLRDDIRS